MTTIAWFGRRLDAPAFEDAQEIDVPVGAVCLGCDESIEEGDAGITMPYLTANDGVSMGAYHIECHLRSILGGRAHQEKRCSCFGGTDHDGYSREDSKAVLEFILSTGGRWMEVE